MYTILELRHMAFRGLLTKMTEGKPKTPKITFSERNIILRGLRRYIQLHPKARNIPMQIINENIFFDQAPD